MKKITGLFLSFFVSLSLIFNVAAAESVPNEVMQAKHSVVRILAEYSDEYYTGSGFVIQANNDSTLLVTNHHVIQDNPINISIWISEDELVNAKIIADSKQKDLCVLKIEKDVGLKELKLSAVGASQGEAVYAIGFPAAADYLPDDMAHTSQDATITDGIVSALRDTRIIEDGDPTKILQISAALNSGNSGGPLFNAKGEVVGINTYGISDSQGIFGAVDVSELKAFLVDNDISAKDNSNLAVIIGAVILAIALIAVLVIVIIKIKSNHKKNKAWSISLREYMANHPDGLDIYEAVSFLLPIALQIRDLHNNGTPHLQISPDSIQVSKDKLKLLPASHNETDRYTSGFAAPEIYKGQSAGILSDMYSFCSVLLYVVTGSTPVNAVTREETSSAAFVADERLNGLSDILEKGMSLCPEDRLPDFQSLIYQISKYNVNPYIVEAPQKGNLTQKKIRQKKPKKEIQITQKTVTTTMIVLLLILVVGYTASHILGLHYAKIGNPEKTAQFIIMPQFTKMIDKTLGVFAIGSHELVGEEYESAKQHFQEISGELSSDEMVKETDYRLANSLVKQEKFNEAITIFEGLGSFKDSPEKALETQFAKGQYLLYKKQEYIDAINIFKDLTEKGYPQAADQLAEAHYETAMHYVEDDELLAAYRSILPLKNNKKYKKIFSEIQELTYMEAVVLYRRGAYGKAEIYFNKLDTYSDSRKYKTLLYAHAGLYNGKSPEEILRGLLNILHFEDAANLILDDGVLRDIYLEGTWRENDGGSFIFDKEGYASTNLPKIFYGDYYTFEDGIYQTYPKNNEHATRNIFKFNIIGEDCIDIYCYKDGSMHTLYRQ